MKIPRYAGATQGSTSVASGRTLQTGAQGGAALAQSGKNMLATVSAYGQQQVKFAAQMRDLEMNTLNENGKVQSITHNEDFVFNLQGQGGYGGWEKSFLKSYDKLTQQKKKEFTTDGVFDDVAWSKHEPDHLLRKAEGLKAVRQKVTAAKLKAAQKTFGTASLTASNQINAAGSPQEVMSIFTTWRDTTLKNGGQLLSAEAYNSALKNMTQLANSQFITQQATVGLGDQATLMSPDGMKQTNWSAVTNQIKNPEFTMYDVDGNELEIDSPLRQALITEYSTKATNQNTYNNGRRVELARDEKSALTNQIMQLAAGTPLLQENGEPIDIMANIAGAEFISDETKITLKNQLVKTVGDNAVTAEKTVKKWNTPEGDNANALLTAMVYGNLIDTAAEKDILLDMGINQFIKPERLATLMGRVDENITEANKPLVMHYRNASKAVLSAVGAGQDILDFLSGDAQSLSAADMQNQMMSILGSGKNTQLAVKAINNMNYMLAEGEAKGIPISEMLVNANSPHYIVDDVIAVYTDQAKSSEIQDFANKAQTFIINEQSGGGFGDFQGFRIDAGAWIAYQNVNNPAGMPPAKRADETIEQYLPRLQQWNLNQGGASSSAGLPTFLGTNRAMESAGASNIVVTNE